MGLPAVCHSCNRCLLNFYYMHFILEINLKPYIEKIKCLNCRISILLNTVPWWNYPIVPKNLTSSENVILS